MDEQSEEMAVTCPDCGTRYWKWQGEVWYRPRRSPQTVLHRADLMPRITWCPTCLDEYARDGEA